MLDARTCYAKWIESIPKWHDHKTLPHDTAELFKIPVNKVTLTKGFHSTHGRGKVIQEILERSNTQDTWERDVAMWYGYCKESSRGARMCRRLFSIFRQRGILYRKQNGSWGDFGKDFPHVPVASLLSHGDRITILLPPSMEQHKLKAVYRTLKGLTTDPLKATFWKGSWHTFRLFENKVGHTLGTGIYRLSGMALLSEILPAITGAKAYETGDDTIFDWVRVWKFYKGENLHQRHAATHNTHYNGFDGEDIILNRKLWFSEQKAAFKRNYADSFLGRHYFKNVALGGKGNINPFSGVKIAANGEHGHLYVNYQAPTFLKPGCILVGCEGSAPAVPDQSGKAHDTAGTKGRWSPTGGRKWNELMPNTFWGMPGKEEQGYKAAKKNVTKFVCDLSDLPTKVALDFVSSDELTADKLHYPIKEVKPANWDELLRLFEKAASWKGALQAFFGGRIK